MSEWKLRPAARQDCEIYWKWANEPSVRAMAFHPEPIPWESHCEWFAKRLTSPTSHLFVLEDGPARPVGQVRFDEVCSGVFEIDFSIAQEGRGQGLGKLILAEGEAALRERVPHGVLRAQVKRNNVASQGAFLANGYVHTSRAFSETITFEKSLITPKPIALPGGVVIGAGATFVIAEIGSNHACSLDLALESIDAAAATGADAVKFQSIQLDELYHHPSEATQALHRKIDLPEEWHAHLKQRCDERGVKFLSSATYLRAVDVLESVGTEIYKLASAQIAVFPQLVRRVAELGKPVVLSTGLVLEEELERVVRIFREVGNDQFIILHCNSVYPAPAEIVQMPQMLRYRQRFGCLTGFSDHTETNTASVAAVALGACVLERHFTLDRGLDSPDAPLSLVPAEFKRFVQAVREAETVLRMPEEEKLEPDEARFKGAIRHTLVTQRDLQAGEVITKDNTRLMRGNTDAEGIDAWKSLEMTDRAKTVRGIPAGTWLKSSDLV